MRQFDDNDPFLIILLQGAEPTVSVETQPTMLRAEAGCDTLNEHAKKNGRPENYRVVKNPRYVEPKPVSQLVPIAKNLPVASVIALLAALAQRR